MRIEERFLVSDDLFDYFSGRWESSDEDSLDPLMRPLLRTINKISDLVTVWSSSGQAGRAHQRRHNQHRGHIVMAAKDEKPFIFIQRFFVGVFDYYQKHYNLDTANEVSLRHKFLPYDQLPGIDQFSWARKDQTYCGHEVRFPIPSRSRQTTIMADLNTIALRIHT